MCPLGDDPGTYSYLYGHEGTAPFVKEVWWPQQNELQLIECLATGGTFDLTFRRAKAERIPYNATRKELKALGTPVLSGSLKTLIRELKAALP